MYVTFKLIVYCISTVYIAWGKGRDVLVYVIFNNINHIILLFFVSRITGDLDGNL